MIFFNLFLFLIAAVLAMFITLGIISRRGHAPGLAKDGRLMPLPRSPNCVSSESGTPEAKRVAPLPENNLDKIAAALENTGGAIKSRTKSYIHAEYKSEIFGFIDDVECRADDGVTQIRSASRVGYSDRGVNRRRVEHIRTAL